jgi:hypothetical protein
LELTEIDLKATLKETGCRFYNYTILGPAIRLPYKALLKIK